ncbi:MAG: glycoside hydrolase [Thiothrix lacustris]|uniref:Glycoside hydrolase n=1 Tax=Thiothrix lacustris TaxID=525917 RepID=A0A1Y1QTS3_9GAMM|nr:MAG: glycoside hydrolase [Thiothrix lacustris]
MSNARLQLVSNHTRLSVVTETWPPEINGVAHSISRMVGGLRTRGGYNIQLVRPRQMPNEKPQREALFHEHLVNGLTLPFYKEVRLGFPQYNALKSLWKKQRPDIVQIVTEGPLGYSAMKAAKKLGIPVISDFHTNFDQYSRYYRLSGFFNLAKRYLRHVHNQTLVTLVPTRELQQQLSANGYTKLGILDRGIDVERFNPQRRSETLRAQLGIRPEQLLVTLVSRMSPEKNLDLAFHAFRAIQKQVPDARFLLVGDGPERKRLQDAHPDCLFVGMQTGIALAEHYASGDVFLYPSTSETFGNVVLEAMASGLPVVTFDYAAAHEHLRSGINGMGIPLDDNAAFIQAGITLALDPALRRVLGQAAHQTALGLSWEKVVERLHHTIQNVLREVHHEHEALAST